MNKKQKTRKPAMWVDDECAMRVRGRNNIFVLAVGRGYGKVSVGYVSVNSAKRLQAWIGKAVKYLEEKK